MASLLGKSFKIQSTASDTSGVQFRVGYDGSNKADFSVSSGGDLTIAPSGGDTSVTGTLSISGNVSIADKIIHTGDTNTAIRFPANDTVTVETAGSEALRIDSSGNVGIGVTPSDTKVYGRALDMGSNLGAAIYLRDSDNPTTQFMWIGYDGTNDNISIYNQANGPMRFGTNNTERMRIDSSGNVGINDSSPSYKLDVNGTARVTGATTLDSTLTVSGDANFDSGTLFVDVSTDRVGIGTTSPTTALHVRRTSGASIVKSNSTDTASYASLDAEGNDGSGTLYRFGSTYSTSAQYIASSTLLESSTGPLLLSAAAAETVRVYTNAAERMRIDSSGRVGIGVSSPAEPLEVRTATVNTGMLLYNTNTNAAQSAPFFIASEAGSSTTNVSIENATSGNFVFRTGATSANGFGTERMRITSDGYVRLITSGGIQFNGDTAAANALDDYEEGTFTPRIEGTTTAGTGTYTQQVGGYIKIGRLVHIQMTLVWTAHTGTGNMRIAGFPFTSLATLDGQGALHIGYNNGLSFSSGYTLTLYHNVNNTIATFVQYNNSGTLTAVPMDTAVAEITITGTYIAA